MLTSEIIRRVKEIQIRTGRQVSDVLAGEYMSVFKGGGVEFDEVRPYIPGDDVRTIDWNVTARSGQPFVKRFQEERQLSLMMVADVSASQDFGSQSKSKREITAELCALLAFSAIHNDDKVGLILFHGEIEQYIPPRKGQTHALRVVREVLAHGREDRSLRHRPEPPPVADRLAEFKGWWRAWRSQKFFGCVAAPIFSHRATNITRAMDFLMTVGKRRNVCFLVSDFFDHDFERAVAAANRKHDVIAVLVSDVREEVLPDVGLITLKDAETGQLRVVDTGSRAFRDSVARLGQQRVEGLKKRLASLGIDFIHIDTSGNVVDPLIRFFRMRERRIRR
ncbi:MAG: hypothetical protein HW380_3007 [Magnetococcales bacterium]|nr:hypothetical protein [Magnetococcales bacterium]HIJ82734.1 DUF58 domain-containing protein [Magnetococcales bacterium]